MIAPYIKPAVQLKQTFGGPMPLNRKMVWYGRWNSRTPAGYKVSQCGQFVLVPSLVRLPREFRWRYEFWIWQL